MKVRKVTKVQKVLNLLYKQVRIRPRLRLFGLVLPMAVLALVGSAEAANFVDANRDNVVVAGIHVLASAEEAPVDGENVIGQTVGGRRSPFDFVMPVDGHISQGYSAWHRANDIAAPLGSDVRPVGTGIVAFAGFMSDGHGNTVIVDHGDGLKSSYAHLGKIHVGVGNAVQSGIAVGTIGLTGRTTGPHVHFEVFDNDITVDPQTILPH